MSRRDPEVQLFDTPKECPNCHSRGILRKGDRCAECGFLSHGSHRAMFGRKHGSHTR